jgi:hypothetical protein
VPRSTETGFVKVMMGRRLEFFEQSLFIGGSLITEITEVVSKANNWISTGSCKKEEGLAKNKV